MNATVSCYNDILEIHATVALKSRDLFFYLWTLGFWYNISQSSGSVNNYWNWWISEKVFVILKKFPGNTKMKIKTTVRYHFIPVRTAIIKKSRNSKCWRGCGEKGALLHCWWEYKLIQPLWRTVWRFLKKKTKRNKTTIWPSNPPTGHIPWENHNSKRRR